MTYGQGVAPGQTLATHIARFANMVYLDQLVWVDNLGQSSGNIWHSWVPFERLAETVRFDAVVFSLCHNDAQIFESNSVRYGNDVAATWLRDGALHTAVQRTLKKMAQTAARLNVRLVLNLYTFWDKDADIVDAVARECTSNSIAFVDLLRFLKQESGLSIAEFGASPFDGHPSDSGHRAAARRITEELREHWKPQSSDRGSLADRLIEACDQAVRDGWSPDDITHWALLVIEGKEIVARRRRSGPETAMLGDLAAARMAIQERYRGWYTDRASAAQAHLLHDRRHNLEPMLEGAYSTLRNLDEMTFVLENFQEQTIAAELWRAIWDAGYYREQNRLQNLATDLKAQFLSTAQSLKNAPSPHATPVLRKFGGLCRDVMHSIRRLASLLPDRFLASELPADLIGLWQVAQYQVNTSMVYVRQFEQAVADTAVEVPLNAAFFTTIDVRVERDKSRPKRGGVYNLTVEIDYIEPRRARRCYKLWAGADADGYLYRFEMPLMLLGDVGIGVPDWDAMHQRFLDGELKLGSIEIWNSADPGAQMRFHWKPAPGAAPSHWLRFDRLLVAA